MIVPGWNLSSSADAIHLAEAHPQILAAVGIHPTEWQTATKSAIDEIHRLAEHPKVVAIGEIGLDYHHEPDHKSEQVELLQAMLAVAQSTGKPILLHSRESLDDLVVLISRWLQDMKAANPIKKFPGIFHAFEGSFEQALEIIDLGFKLGVGGPLTFKSAELKRNVFLSIPEESIVLETDSPLLSPVPLRGKRNEPANLSYIGSALAQLRNQPKEEFLERNFQNSYKMFLKEIVH